jgi:hypothetical protein
MLRPAAVAGRYRAAKQPRDSASVLTGKSSVGQIGVKGAPD